MEPYFVEHDMPLLCVEAKSFPAGVLAAQQQLHRLLDGRGERQYFGISWPVDGEIRYKAAATALQAGEATTLGCEPWLLNKGEYISLLIPNFMDDVPAIGRAFEQLLAHPRIDPQGACVEVYLNETDVRCMVRLADEE